MHLSTLKLKLSTNLSTNTLECFKHPSLSLIKLGFPHIHRPYYYLYYLIKKNTIYLETI